MYFYDALAKAILIFALLVIFACPICSSALAYAKGRDSTAWFLMGLFFGPFGLIAAAGMPVLENSSARRARRDLSSEMKLCDFCCEPVHAEATVCRYCTSTLIEA